VTEKLVYCPGIDEAVCMIDVAGGGEIYYYQYYRLGSVAALSDVNGTVEEANAQDILHERQVKGGTR